MLFTYVDLYITIFRNCNCSFYFVIEDLISSAINEERTRNCYLLIFFLFKEKWINKFSAPRMETKHNGNTHQGKIYKGEVGGPLSLNQNRSSGLSEKVGRQSTQSTRSTPTINRGWINCESFHRFLLAIRPILHLRERRTWEQGKNDNPFLWARASVGEAINRSLRGRLSLRHSPNFSFFFFPRPWLSPRPILGVHRHHFSTVALHGSVFTKILSLFPRTLSARDVCRRIP